MEREHIDDQQKIYKSLTHTVTEIQREHVRLKQSLSRIEQDQAQLRKLIAQVRKMQEELRETMFGVHQDHTAAAAGVLELQRYCVQVDDRLGRLERNQADIKTSLAALSQPDPEPEPKPDQPKWKFWA